MPRLLASSYCTKLVNLIVKLSCLAVFVSILGNNKTQGPCRSCCEVISASIKAVRKLHILPLAFLPSSKHQVILHLQRTRFGCVRIPCIGLQHQPEVTRLTPTQRCRIASPQWRTSSPIQNRATALGWSRPRNAPLARRNDNPGRHSWRLKSMRKFENYQKRTSSILPTARRTIVRKRAAVQRGDAERTAALNSVSASLEISAPDPTAPSAASVHAPGAPHSRVHSQVSRSG